MYTHPIGSKSFAVGLLALGLLQTPDLAWACLNGVYTVTQGGAQRDLKLAELALEKGHYRSAQDLLAGLHPGLSGTTRRMDVQVLAPLHRRIARAQAVVFLHTGLPLLGRVMIEALLQDAPDDPYLKARWAEGLSRSPGIFGGAASRQQARRLLEELAQADLMPDGDAYRALAQLRDLDGDAAGRDHALARCKQRISDERRCQLEPLPAAATPLAAAQERLLRDPWDSAAQKTLEELARADTLTDAAGYMALIRFRAAAGDLEGQKQAQLRCRRLLHRSLPTDSCTVPDFRKLRQLDDALQQGKLDSALQLTRSNALYTTAGDPAFHFRIARANAVTFLGIRRAPVAAFNIAAVLHKVPDDTYLLIRYAEALKRLPYGREVHQRIALHLLKLLDAVGQLTVPADRALLTELQTGAPVQTPAR